MDTMDMHKHEVAKTAKTMVWWNIDSCPVPDGFDAHLIGPCIESALKNSGYAGPLTITAFGNLKRTLKHTPDVLPAISSTGIVLKFTTRALTSILDNLLIWTRNNQPPANLMFITGGNEHFTHVLCDMRDRGYTTILQAYFQVSKVSSSLPTVKEWLWDTILKDAMDSGVTGTHELQEKHSGTGESGWFCINCQLFMRNFAGQSFKDFTTHLKSKEHALSELDSIPMPIRTYQRRFARCLGAENPMPIRTYQKEDL